MSVCMSGESCPEEMEIIRVTVSFRSKKCDESSCQIWVVKKKLVSQTHLWNVCWHSFLSLLQNSSDSSSLVRDRNYEASTPLRYPTTSTPVATLSKRPDSEERRYRDEDEAAGYTRIEDIKPGKGQENVEIKDVKQNGMTDEEFLNRYCGKKSFIDSQKDNTLNNGCPLRWRPSASVKAVWFVEGRPQCWRMPRIYPNKFWSTLINFYSTLINQKL